MQDIQRHLSDLLALLICDQDREVTIPEFGTLRKKSPRNRFGHVQGRDIVRQFRASLVCNGLRVDQIEMIARHVYSLESRAQTQIREISFRRAVRARGICENWNQLLTGTLLNEQRYSSWT